MSWNDIEIQMRRKTIQCKGNETKMELSWSENKVQMETNEHEIQMKWKWICKWQNI